MNTEKIVVEKLIGGVPDLIESYRDLISLKLVAHTSLGLSLSIVGLVSMMMVVFVLLFTGIGSAWWIGEQLDNMKAGFFIVGGFYTLLLMILLVIGPKIIVPKIRNLIIKKIYEQN